MWLDNMSVENTSRLCQSFCPGLVSAAVVPGLPLLPGVAGSDSIYQPASLHVLQCLVHVSERQLGGGTQTLPGPASIWYEMI